MKKLLFLCTGNSCRSQMAEGFINHFFSSEWAAYSAGTHPAERIHPLAVHVMDELGIDISGGRPKNISEFLDVNFDLVFTVCDDAAENCPLWLGKGRVIHKSFIDPAKATGSLEQQIAIFQSVRDEIQDAMFTFFQA